VKAIADEPTRASVAVVRPDHGGGRIGIVDGTGSKRFAESRSGRCLNPDRFAQSFVDKS